MSRTQPFRIHPYRSLLPVVESMSVMHIAEPALEYISATDSVASVHQWMAAKRFDVAPIDEARPRRFVVLEDLGSQVHTIEEVARPIDASILLPVDLPLLDAVALLEEQKFYFVLGRRGLAGIVTRSDLQRPAVAMASFALILAAELAMDRVVERELRAWVNHLTVKERADVETRYEQLTAKGVEISMFECLRLRHRIKLLMRCPAIWSHLGFNNQSDLRSWCWELNAIRNDLAHGRTLLNRLRTSQEAINLFLRLRQFCEGLWNFAEMGNELDRGRPRGDHGPPTMTDIDARQYLSDLVGRTIFTMTGRPNRVIAIEGEDVIVGTSKSPTGQAVPIAWVQDAIDRLIREGGIEVSVPSVGYRSAFIGAVLMTLPGTRRESHPLRVILEADR